MSINITNFVPVIEKTELFQSLQGTDKFKQKLLTKNYKNIYHDFEQARRLGIDYVVQYMTSTLEVKLIKELIQNDNDNK